MRYKVSCPSRLAAKILYIPDYFLPIYFNTFIIFLISLLR